jgi:tetratricopeptide (TPR) repeat protein
MKSGRIFFGLIFLLVVACPTLAQEVGKIMSIIGTAEVLRKEQWHSISLHEALQPGDVVKTGPGSRLAVLLTDGSQIKVNANSRLVLKQVASPTRRVAMRLVQSLLRLFSGEIWIRSLGGPLEIETLAAAATIRGTELNLAVESTDTAHLAVVEGVVEFHNPKGSVRVGAQEQALAKAGEAPRKTVLLNPLDAVQWSLYYPGIVSYRDYSLAEVGPALLQKRLTELERRAATAPQDVNTVIALGEVLFDLGKRMEARNQFEKALRLAPRDPRAHTGLGWVYLEAGESEAALKQFRQAKPPTLMSLVGKAHALYRLDRFEEALKVIARAKQSFPTSPRPWTQAALISLVQGRVPEALVELDRTLRLDPKYALAHGLRSNIYLVRNQKERALEAAQRAVAANPLSPTAHLDLSLVKQVEFKLEEALKAARKAVELDPDNPQALIQVSRLLFGQGEIDEAFELAERARRLAPQDPVVLSTWGFLQLAWGKVNEAIGAFDRAIVQDSTRGEPHLGKGLALFRRGKTEDGVKEMRIATLLEPKVSLYHSYLGKAFYEVKEDKRAEQQLALAKALDPRDPTPYFYDAIRKQTINRPVEALRDLQKSIELNDNRAVYRSRLLLDEDRAVRGTSLARIYDDLGFDKRALVEASKSLSLDPTDYSAHRFLSDTYARLPRHQIARVSELLQAQLLQPININPIQPQLNETNLNIVTGAGPARANFNEYSRLFERNRPQLILSGFLGNNNTFGDEAVLSGIHDRVSYSFGQFHYETDGFREKADVQHDIYNAFTQLALTDKINVQFEYRRRETDQGDIRLNFDPEFMPTEKRSLQQDIGRAGLHISASPSSDFIASLIYTDRKESLAFTPDPSGTLDIRENRHGYDAEGQYLFRGNWLNLTVGGGNYEIDVSSRNIFFGTPETCAAVGEPPGCSDEPEIRKFPIEQHNIYAYTNLSFPKNLTWTIGLSYDSYDEESIKLNKVNPKFGLQWNITDRLRLRAAFLRTLKRQLLVDQTIEPTQVAGFNQFFDDFNGTRTEIFGIGLDAILTDTLYGGAEVSRRNLVVPFKLPPLPDGSTLVSFADQHDDRYRAYLYWTPDSNWALSAEYLFEGDAASPRMVETHSIPLAVRYFSPVGVFTELSTTFVWQDVEQQMPVLIGGDPEDPRPGFTQESEDFAVVDAAIGYRLPKRRGIVSLEARNLFDEQFLFQDLSFKTSDQIGISPRFIPDRTILFLITLNF